MMVYYTQNYHIFGALPIVQYCKTRGHNISETGSASSFRMLDNGQSPETRLFYEVISNSYEIGSVPMEVDHLHLSNNFVITVW
jgi:hypothetical protein